jgi:hypothetical protein
VKGDPHAGICGSRGVRFPPATRQGGGETLLAIQQRWQNPRLSSIQAMTSSTRRSTSSARRFHSGQLMKGHERFMTTAAVAELLRMPVESVHWWRHVGKGP